MAYLRTLNFNFNAIWVGLTMGTCRHYFHHTFSSKSLVFNEIVIYQELFGVVMLPTSSSNHVRDRNYNIEKGKGKNSELCSTFFDSEIPLPSSHHLHVCCQTWSKWQWMSFSLSYWIKIIISSIAMIVTFTQAIESLISELVIGSRPCSETFFILQVFPILKKQLPKSSYFYLEQTLSSKFLYVFLG